MDDEIIVKYVADVKNLEAGLNKISARLDSVESKAQKSSKGITTSLKSVAGAMGVAFGAQQAIQLGREMVTLAAKAEGVERAFKRIGSPQLLADLRKATRGTVSDLVLMQNAIKAANFKIPLDQMGTLLKFAGARARETGESVEYLVNSIIMGIGRKSPMILDNLGISAIELRKRFDGISVASANVADVARIVGDIANEELAKMGVQADTTADKLEQLTTKYENVKVVIGNQLILALDQLSDAWDLTAESELKALDGFDDYKDSAIEGMIPIIGPLSKVGQLWQFVASNMRLAVGVASDVKDEFIKVAHRLTLNNDELVDYLKLSDSAQLITAKLTLGLSDYGDVTGDAEKATEQFNKQFAEQDIAETIRNLAYYDELIKGLQETQKGANITRAEVRDLQNQINEASEERLKLLGKLSPAEKEAAKALKEALELDLDDDIGIDGLAKQLSQVTDDFIGESERATSSASDVWGSHFDTLMSEQDEFYASMRQNTEDQEELQQTVLGSTLQAWSTFTNNP